MLLCGNGCVQPASLALTIDLRGHGGSKEKAGAPLTAEASWRSDSKQFPLDLDSAIQWLKARKRCRCEPYRSDRLRVGCRSGFPGFRKIRGGAIGDCDFWRLRERRGPSQVGN